VTALSQLRAADALIAFSRRDVLEWAEQLARLGRSVATIYGNLSPEVRQSQAEAFRDGRAQILVATDAIGMGLNLAISRVVFTTAIKYDGYEEAELPAWLAQQIGGRAGRFGLSESGEVAGFGGRTHRTVAKLMTARVAPLGRTGFSVAPGIEHLRQISDATGERRLSALLKLFQHNIDVHDEFFLPTGLTEQLERASWLDALRLSLEERFLFSLVPLSTRVASLDNELRHWARNTEARRPTRVTEAWIGNGPRALQAAEDACKAYSAYAWLGYRMPELFPDGEMATALARETSVRINRILQAQYSRPARQA
jgi:ATP-dependent RNA helicase SUPV3L1/SUV3